MKYNLSIFVLMSSFTTWAGPSKDAVSLLEKVNQNLQSSSALQCVEGDDPAELEACAIALCGSPETAVVAGVNDQNFDLYVKDGIKERFSELEAPVKKVYQNKQAKLQKFSDSFKTLLESGKPLLDFTDWKGEYQDFAQKIYNSHLELTVDTTKPLEERQSYKISLPKGASENYIKGIKAYAEAKKAQNLINIPSGMYDGLYTTEESQKLIKDLWKTFYNSYQAERIKNPEFMKDQEPQIKKYLEPDYFEKTDVFELGNAYSNLYYLDTSRLMSLNLPYENLKYDIECTEGCKTGIQENLKTMNFSQMLKDLGTEAQNFKLEDALLECQADLVQNNLKDSDREEFRRNFPEIKKNFMEKTFKGYSTHSKEAFEKYLADDLGLSFDPDSSKDVEIFLSELIEKGQDSEESKETKNIDMIKKLLDYRSWADETKMDPDMHVCQDMMGSQAFAAWDAFAPKEHIQEGTDADPEKDNLFVSLFTCSHGPQGKGVVSHEMGHALSYAFSKDKLSPESKSEFLRMRKCVNESHIGIEATAGSFLEHKGDTLYSEEDMADVISFYAIDPADPVFTCALLDTNKTGTKFKDPALVNKFSFDSHSAPLLRVIREAIYKKKHLPPSCRQVIEKNKDKFRFEPCL